MTDDVLAEARERFRRCATIENDAREAWKADMRFNYGDDINNDQWDSDLYSARNKMKRPCQTVNRTKQYTQHVINDSLQNKAAIKIRAVGDEATYKSAEIMEGIVRHIEYISNSQDAYFQASHDQVISGIGYWYLETDYIDGESFDQEIYIRQIPDALSVYIDPEVKRNSAGEDAKFGFIFSDANKKELERDYPDVSFSTSATVLNEADQDYRHIYTGMDTVRVVQYFRMIDEPDTLHVLSDGSTMKESESADPKSLRRISMKSRDVKQSKCQWFKIAGDHVLEQRDLVWKFIPIVRVCGTETFIDGQLDRRGVVRDLRGPQKALNWYTSGGIEYVAMQTKSSWIASAESIEGYETYWNTSNTVNHAVLPYRALDEEGKPLLPPTRVDPPAYPAAFSDGRNAAIADMQLTSGMTDAQMGDNGNERSGAGIDARAKQAANSIYAFPERLANALAHTGRLIISAIPKIYDTPRTMKILAIDNTPTTIQVNPAAPTAHQDIQGADAESISPNQVAMIFNPSVGKYDVIATAGKQYSTARREAADALGDMMAQNEGLADKVMDIWASLQDFPTADILAQRFRNMLPPQATGMINPQVQQLQQAVQEAAMHNAQLDGKNKQLESKALAEATQKEIDIQKAKTEFLSVLFKADPEGGKAFARHQMSQMGGVSANILVAAQSIEEQELQSALSAMAPQTPPGQGQGPQPQ